MGYDQDVFILMYRADGKTTCEVPGSPLVLVEGKGAAPSGKQWIDRHRGEGGRVRCGRKYAGG